MTVALRRINIPRQLNILCCPTHEGYQTNLSKTGHNFYMLSGPGIKTWDYHTRPLPANSFIYNKNYDAITTDIPFDLVLSQERHQQLPLLKNIAERFGIPLLHVDHTEPIPQWNSKQFAAVTSIRANRHVYITPHNRTTWKDPNGSVVPHGIDTDLFSGWTGENPRGLSVVNYFPQRDLFCGWNLWKSLVDAGTPVDLVGENPGLSESISDINKLAEAYKQHRFYLNTSQLSPVPLSCLEAMACGCPIVTTAKQQLPDIIQNGVNGFISNDPGELMVYCKILLEDHNRAKYLGENARKTILEKYSMNNFVENWNREFYGTIKEYIQK